LRRIWVESQDITEWPVDHEYLFERAKLRMKTSKAEFMVANKTGSLYGEESEHFIVSTFQLTIKYSNKKETAEGLLHLLADHIN
jgi:phosphopantothenate---cysteine ligase (CTP)